MIAIWAISALAVAGVIIRPWRIPEWIAATAGAALLLATGLLPFEAGARAVMGGLDVYLFLIGMMLLAEIARREGLFAWLAVLAVRSAKASPLRLFSLLYAVGTLVTIFLSNDATAVVLTPAVAAVTRAAGVERPTPYLLICAFVANAASFMLPISNPANLVVFGDAMPPLGAWLARFALASIVSILATYAVLLATQRSHLTGRIRDDLVLPRLTIGARIAAVGLVAAAATLLVASALGVDLGWPTALAGLLTMLTVAIGERASPLPVLRNLSWDTLVLVAALFVIVAALQSTAMGPFLVEKLKGFAAADPNVAAAGAGVLAGFASNLTNNLPLGLIAGTVVAEAHVPTIVHDALLIGIDIGPNLSVTGSLATILWLMALRRENLSFGALAFLRLGLLVMPAALLPALAVILLQTLF